DAVSRSLCPIPICRGLPGYFGPYSVFQSNGCLGFLLHRCFLCHSIGFRNHPSQRAVGVLLPVAFSRGIWAHRLLPLRDSPGGESVVSRSTVSDIAAFLGLEYGWCDPPRRVSRLRSGKTIVEILRAAPPPARPRLQVFPGPCLLLGSFRA